MRHYLEEKVQKYGLGIIFAANVFGAGSVYILSSSGANHGFSLLWVLPLAFMVDLVMHDMSSRLATIDKPLMGYIRERIGSTSIALALVVSFIMQFWAVANYAVAGAALAWLTPINNVYFGILISAGLGISLVQLKIYDRIEAIITALILVVFGSYIILLSGLSLPIDKVVQGFIPVLQTDIGYLTSVIALLGTTVYYPNFFIQSSIYPTKGWDSIWKFRKDNIVGITATIALSIAVMMVSALTLTGVEMQLTSPGAPLVSLLGDWAITIFVVAAALASFTSATGTLFGAGFMVPQSFDRRTVFGDRAFRATVIGLIAISVVIALFLLHSTNFTPVWLAITMPAVNGIIGLPLTVVALWAAVNKYFEPSLKENVVFGLTSLVLLAGSALTARSLYETIMSLI